MRNFLTLITNSKDEEILSYLSVISGYKKTGNKEENIISLNNHLELLLCNTVINDGEKMEIIKYVYSNFDKEKIPHAKKLRDIGVINKDIGNFSSRVSKVISFIERKSIKIGEAYSNAKPLYDKLLNNGKKVHHHDIYNYLIRKNVCKEFTTEKLKKIKGSYILFRYSERGVNLINISKIELENSGHNNILTFNNKRKGIHKCDELEIIKTEGIFFRNTANTFVCLGISKTSDDFTFIETITTLKSRKREKTNHIVGLYTGDTLSNNDYDNRPFSTKVVLVKVDKELITNFSNFSAFRDHKVSDIKDIVNEINFDKLKIIAEKMNLDYSPIKYQKDDINHENEDKKQKKEIDKLNNCIDIKNKENMKLLLEKLNTTTSLNIILEKIKNKIDKNSQVFILKK